MPNGTLSKKFQICFIWPKESHQNAISKLSQRYLKAISRAAGMCVWPKESHQNAISKLSQRYLKAISKAAEVCVWPKESHQKAISKLSQSYLKAISKAAGMCIWPKESHQTRYLNALSNVSQSYLTGSLRLCNSLVELGHAFTGGIVRHNVQSDVPGNRPQRLHMSTSLAVIARRHRRRYQAAIKSRFECKRLDATAGVHVHAHCGNEKETFEAKQLR